MARFSALSSVRSVLLRSKSTALALLAAVGAVACATEPETHLGATADAVDSQVLPLNEELPVAQQAGEPALFERLGREINEIQQKKAEANGGVARGFHAKPHGCVLGQLQVLPNRAEETKFGVFKETKTFPAWIRLSNATSSRQSDRSPDLHGLAVKVLNVPGAKLFPGQETATTQDFLGITTDSLGTKDAESFMEFQKALNEGGGAMAAFTLWHAPLVFKLISAASRPIASMFNERYFSGVPFKLGPRATKFSFTPCAQLDRGDGSRNQSSKFLREDVVSTLESGTQCFNLSVQFQRDAAKQPVEDSSVSWDENEAPFVPVARLILPKQDMRSEEAVRKEGFCEGLVWNPWHSLEEHRPIGNANRARKIVMTAAQKYRGATQPPAEPTGTETF